MAYWDGDVFHFTPDCSTMLRDVCRLSATRARLSIIGRGLADPRSKLALASTIAIGLVANDLWLVSVNSDLGFRALPILAGVILFGGLSKWDFKSLGLHLGAPQPFTFWLLVAGVAGGAIVVASLPHYIANPHDLASMSWWHHGDPTIVWHQFKRRCLEGPVVEEGIYRLVLCAPLAPAIGKKPTIAVSGVLFAGLHCLQGNISAASLLGGFVLAWAYLKSETLLVPVALHVVGNAAAMSIHFLAVITLT